MDHSGGESITVLHVDDEPEVLELAATFLERERAGITVETTTDVGDALERLADDEAVDCVVSDYQMPEMDGLAFLAAARERRPGIPFVLFTGQGSEEIASEAISAGVTDYFQKGGGAETYAMLANRIENAVAQQRAERAVERTQRRFHTLIEASADVIAVIDPDGTFGYVSPAAENVLGYAPAELEGEPAFANVHPDDSADVQAVFFDLVQDPSLRPTLEFRYEDRGGEWITLQAHGRNLLADPDIEGIVVYARDVTERRESERELDHYHRIVETMGDGVYALDADGAYAEVNEKLLAMTGYDRAELLGESATLLHEASDIERFEAAIAELYRGDREGPTTLQATLSAADGTEIPVEVTLTILPGEPYQGSVGVVRDVTERRERERELEEYERLVHAIPDEVYTLDAEGRFTSIIPPTDDDVTTTGHAPEDLVGEPVSVLMDEADIEQGEAAIRELLRSPDRERTSFEMETVARDGERVPHENHIALLTGEDGEFRGTVGVLRDITDRRERERELERQNERLERFAAVVSHDLRNPLNVARMNLDLLSDADPEYVEPIDRAHDRMEQIIDELLTLAKTGQAVDERTAVDLDAVAADAWDHVETADATLSVETTATVEADPNRLQQLFENLARNAVEHGGDEVAVTVGALEGGFYVADDGPGIPSEERERVFESGFTTADGGTGLGLAIVSEIVEAHGWDAAVTESADGGARFEVTGVELD
ncbi:MAG: PAS domain S-box protein [Haloarculaceae archaeon]